MTKEDIFGTSKNIEPDRDKKVDEKYYKIPYFKPELSNFFKLGEIIWVEEKIDGTNTSVKLDETSMKAKAFGRRYELSEDFDNRGAYQWLIALADKIKEYYGTKYTFYFEWLVSHNVDYSIENYNVGYLISVQDNATGMYLQQDEVYTIADKLGVKHPPLLYYGEFKGWEHLNTILGTSELGAHTGEGIVVKAYDEKHGQKMIKIVTEKFKERKCFDPAKREAKAQEEQDKRIKAEEIVTDARITKGLFRLIEDGIIKNTDMHNWSSEDKAIAMKHIGKIIFDDCLNEETEFVKEFGKDFGKYSFMICKAFVQKL